MSDVIVFYYGKCLQVLQVMHKIFGNHIGYSQFASLRPRGPGPH